jgi:hypothetical protein
MMFRFRGLFTPGVWLKATWHGWDVAVVPEFLALSHPLHWQPSRGGLVELLGNGGEELSKKMANAPPQVGRNKEGFRAVQPAQHLVQQEGWDDGDLIGQHQGAQDGQKERIPLRICLPLSEPPSLWDTTQLVF